MELCISGDVVPLGERGSVIGAKACADGYPLDTGDLDAMVRNVEDCGRKLLCRGTPFSW